MTKKKINKQFSQVWALNQSHRREASNKCESMPKYKLYENLLSLVAHFTLSKQLELLKTVYSFGLKRQDRLMKENIFTLPKTNKKVTYT